MSINPIHLQQLIKENATDLHDFSKDLKSWGEEMKRKEESFKKDTGVKKSKSKNVEQIPKISNKERKTTEKPQESNKGRTTNYAAWDKFDADAELQKLEDDENEDSELTDECNDNMYDEALIEKENGNKYVKKQEWEKAINSYTKAIECYSYDPIFYANRALCYLKLSKFEAAERDCTLSLKLDSTYVKAYQRRAAALSNLNKLEFAEVDLLKVLELEPKNKESKIELEKIQQKLNRHTEKTSDQRPISIFTASRNKTNLNKTTEKISSKNLNEESIITPDKRLIDDSEPKVSWHSQEDIILVKPIQKPPHLRSQNPLRRVLITEEDVGFLEETIESLKSEEAVKRHVIEKHEKAEDSTDSSYKKKIGMLESENTAWPSSNQPTICLKTDDLKVIERKHPVSCTKDMKNTVNDNKKLTKCNESNVGPVRPKNSVQFYSSWKNFATTEEKYLYLKSIELKDIPKIFLNSLESGVFSNILEVMVYHFINNRDPVFDTLASFTEVKRFSAITMFMTPEDKNNLWKLFDYIKENNEREKADVEILKKKFEL